MELQGTIKTIFEEKQVSASFRKRELVLTTEGRYPQQILIEFTQDKIGLLDRVSPGDAVRIQIDIRGREWTSPRGEVKYFVSIQGWRIESLDERRGGGGGGGGGGGRRRDSSTGGPPDDDVPFPSEADAPAEGPIPDDEIPF